MTSFANHFPTPQSFEVRQMRILHNHKEVVHDQHGMSIHMHNVHIPHRLGHFIESHILTAWLVSLPGTCAGPFTDVNRAKPHTADLQYACVLQS